MRTAKWVSLAAVLWVCAGAALAYEKEVQALSAAMADQISQAGKKSIAVVDFTDLEGNATELGRFLAEEFAVSLAASGKGFEVVDRSNLRTILQEHKLAASGLIDPATAKKLGQIAGVDALITGTLTPFGDSVRLACKILDTSTARVIGGARGDIPRTKAIDDLLGRELGQPGQAQPVAGTQAQASAPAITPGPVEQVAQFDKWPFRFTARPCKLEVRGIVCTVTATNLGETAMDLAPYFWDTRTLLADTQGEQVVAVEAAIGAQSCRAGFSCGQQVQPQIPVNLRFVFRPRSPLVAPLNLVVNLWSSGLGELNVPLRNLALSPR